MEMEMETRNSESQPKIKLVRGQQSFPAAGGVGVLTNHNADFVAPQIRMNTVDDIWRINMTFLHSWSGNGIQGSKMADVFEANRKNFSWLVLVKFDEIRFAEIRAGASSYGSLELGDCQKYYIFSEMELKYSKNVGFNGILFAPGALRDDAAIMAAKTVKEALFLGAKVDFKTEMLVDAITHSAYQGGYATQNTNAKRSNLRRVITEKWDYCPSIGCCGYVAFKSNNDSISREFPLY